MNKKFSVTGMTCTACSGHIEKSLAKTKGVQSVAVNLLGNNMTVTYDESIINEDGICDVVADAGYGACPIGEKAASKPAVDPTVAEAEHKKQRFWWSLLFLVPLFYISMGTMFGLPVPVAIDPMTHMSAFALIQLLLTLPILIINSEYFTHGFRALIKGSPNMDSLIAVGSGAAVIYSLYGMFLIGYQLEAGNHHGAMAAAMDLYFESAATILTLITLGKFLEARSKSKTSEAISKLLDLAPKTAVVLRGESEITIPVEQVVPGDIIIVRPGQSIPVDGVVTEGTSAVDESAITGESIPVEKTTGSPLIAATVNKGGYLRIKATKVGDDTTISQIIRLVEEAASSKAPISKMADKVASIFVPTVMLIATAATIIWLIMGYDVSFALSIGIAVLVISCPCALGLATPVAIMVGTGKGAQHGILIKSGQALETAHSINTVVLDKTGTLTQGKPVVTNTFSFGIEPNEFLSLAAAVETMSEHPLADAIVAQAKNAGFPIPQATDFDSVAGEGVSAIVNGKKVFAGNMRMMKRLGHDVTELESHADKFADEGKTPLFFAADDKIIGIIAVADVIKPTSKAAVAAFKKLGVEVVMLTGDNKKTANAIAAQLGIDNVLAEVLPQDKEAQVRMLQDSGKVVAMVGDGINDAPALTRADVGIAIGAGTDIAIDSADIVLMKSDLMDAVTAMELSRAVIRNIKQNLFWAFFYNTVGIPLAAGVFFIAFGWKLNPTFAAAAMSLSSVSVVTNALRLKLFTPTGTKAQTVSEQTASEQTASEQTASEQTASEQTVSEQTVSEQAMPETQAIIINQNTINTQEGEIKMTKTMKIDGMTCAHCSGRVEKALNKLEGVTATVNLEAGTANIEVTGNVSDEMLSGAVIDAGYDVVSLA